MWILQFSSNNLRNGASYVFDHCKTLMGNRIGRIEWYYLRTFMATGSAQNRVRNPSSSALNIAINGSHVALSRHLLSFLFLIVAVSDVAEDTRKPLRRAERIVMKRPRELTMKVVDTVKYATFLQTRQPQTTQSWLMVDIRSLTTNLATRASINIRK